MIELAFFPLVDHVPASVPLEGQVFDPGGCHLVESTEGFGHDIELVLPVLESAGLESKGIVDELGPRWLTGFEDVQRATQDQRRQTHVFEVPCNQTHGLVTDGSQRYQEQEIDILLADGFGEVGNEFRRHPLLGVDSAHARVVVVGKIANHAVRVELGEHF